MKLEFIDIGNIDDSAVNMRHGKKAPDVSDILPTVRKRGIIVPVILRPGAAEGRFELVAGRRRVHAARIAQADEGADPELGRVPSAIMEAGDVAAALEASLIENLARLCCHQDNAAIDFEHLGHQQPHALGASNIAIREDLIFNEMAH